MDTTVMLPPRPDRRWTLAQQLGIDTAVVRFWGEEEWEYDTLVRTKNRFEDHGFAGRRRGPAADGADRPRKRGS